MSLLPALFYALFVAMFTLHDGIKLLFWLAILIVMAAIFILVFRLYIHSNRKNELLREKNEQLESMNAQLLESEKQLLKLNATKSRLFSIIGHDLRGSMNAIIGFSEIMVKKHRNLTDEELSKYSNIINQSASKLYLMMENLLDWSRTQGENIRFSPETIDLHSIVLNVVTLLEINAYSKNIELVSEVPKNFNVYADKILIASILRNLIDNALKFTNKNGRIVITARKKGDSAEVAVHDTGIGMSSEITENLFNDETHNSTEGTGKEKGTGLGLIISRDFVEMHGGKIWATSEKGKGSILSFTLPLNHQ